MPCRPGGDNARWNGFEWPLHPLQVVSWFVFGIDVIAFIVFGLPMVDSGARVAISVCYILSVVFVVGGAFVATRCNPADAEVLKGTGELDAMRPFCTVCNVPVGPRSKHCRECNKCVDTFDHHCMWLNNCIGAANYRAFFTTITSVAVMTGILLSSCLYLVVRYFTTEDLLEEQAPGIAFLRDVPKEVFLSMYFSLIAVNLPLFLLDGQLFFLHILLMSQKVTTYEYILQKREKADQKWHREMAGEVSGCRRLAKKLLGHLDWIVFCKCGQRRRSRRRRSAEESAAAEAAKAQGPTHGAAAPADANAAPAPANAWIGESKNASYECYSEEPAEAEAPAREIGLNDVAIDLKGPQAASGSAAPGSDAAVEPTVASFARDEEEVARSGAAPAAIIAMSQHARANAEAASSPASSARIPDPRSCSPDFLHEKVCPRDTPHGELPEKRPSGTVPHDVLNCGCEPFVALMYWPSAPPSGQGRQ